MPDNFVNTLLEREEELITKVMSFMSYNPSIGRVLKKGGVNKFQRIIMKMLPELSEINSIEQFNKLHHKYVKKVISNIKTSENSKSHRASYGQAAKPINVFLKVYVDWSKRPNMAVRKKILPYLHVPLDSILIQSIKENHSQWYECKIKPWTDKQEYSLSKINKRIYYRWQKHFREEYCRKPLIFDVAWALYRK